MKVLICGIGLVLGTVVFTSISAAYATIYEVGPGQPYASIQACMNVVIAGDTCNVHAGTYTEQLTLPISGTLANRITVQGNTGETVTIQSSSSPVININAKSYWTLRGLNVTYNGSGSGPRAINNSSGNSDYLTITNCVVTISGGIGSGFGLYLYRTNHLTVTGTTIRVTASTGSHDGADILLASNLEFSGNTIYGNASELTGKLEDGLVVSGTSINVEDNVFKDGWSYDNHPDAIVIQGDGDRNGSHTANVSVARNTVSNFSQGIYFDTIHNPIEGTNVIANNIVYETSAFRYGGVANKMNCILLHGENLSNNPGYAIAAKVYNNTLDCRQLQMFTDDLVDGAAIDIQNNIFVNSPFAGQQILFTNGVSMDYNYYSMGSGTPIRWGGSTYSLTAFRSTIGQESHSATGTVGLNADYTENISSDSRNRGANFFGVFTNDRAGVTRAASPAPWDMGAFVYRADLAAPAAPTNLRVQ